MDQHPGLSDTINKLRRLRELIISLRSSLPRHIGLITRAVPSSMPASMRIKLPTYADLKYLQALSITCGVVRFMEPLPGKARLGPFSGAEWSPQC